MFGVTAFESPKTEKSGLTLPRKSPRLLVEYFNNLSRPFITRYSELECFHRQLIARYPELKTESVFPRKRFWGHYSPSVLKKRADQFSCYFQHLINARNCIYRQASIFRDFFISEQATRVDYISSSDKLLVEIRSHKPPIKAVIFDAK